MGPGHTSLEVVLMKSKRSRLDTLGVLALALSVSVGLALGTVAEAKKKGPKAFNGNGPGVAIPDALAAAPFTYGTASSKITVGKKFKRKKVGDLTVSLQTQGSGNGAAEQTAARLIAPN